MLKTKKIMLYNVSKTAALMNAQAIMASAILFGHGDVVTLSVNDSAVVLSVTFDTAWFVYEREIEWFSDRFMVGVQHKMEECVESKSFTIYMFWSFNPNLK